jgi:hypothetical protein
MRAGACDRLADDVLASVGVGVEPVPELVVHHLLHERARLGVAELGLGLALELRLAELDRDDGGQTLADVLAGEVVVLLLEQPLSRAYLFITVVSAARKPSSWVPPSWC